MGVLRYQGNDTLTCATMTIREITARLKMQKISVDDALKMIEGRLTEVPTEQQDTVAVQLIYDYLKTNFYEA